MAFTQNLKPRLHYIITPMSRRDEADEASIKSIDARESICTHQPAHQPARHHVVFIHGLFLGNLAGWYPLITSLVSAHATSLCYDLRGHGLSERPSRGYSVMDHADDLCALLETLGWHHEPLTLIGHSFGGRVALELARRALHQASPHPSLNVERVMLIDTPITREDDDATLAALRAPQETHRGVDEPEHDAELSRLLSPEVNRQLLSGGRRARKLVLRWRALLEETTLTQDLDQDPLPTRAALEEISATTDLWGLYGERSGARASRQLLSEIIPEHRWRTLSERGHFLLNEAPSEVGAWVVSALACPISAAPHKA